MKSSIYVIVAFFVLSVVSASPVCFPEGDKLCLDGFVMGSYVYCDLDDVVACPNGCDFSKDVCLGSNPLPSCYEGFMKCGIGSVFDAGGDVYRCVSGSWVRSDTCSGSCEEVSATYARCVQPRYYCLSTQGSCYYSSNRLVNCYDSLSECQESKVFYCLSADKSVCVRRTGGCLSGEYSSSGTDEAVVKRSCDAQVCGSFGKSCCSGDVCSDSLKCVSVPSEHYADGSNLKVCKGDCGLDLFCWIGVYIQYALLWFACVVALLVGVVAWRFRG